MAGSKKMKASGRRGGRVGGHARAAAPPPSRPAAIASAAVRSRWAGPALVMDESPRDHGELLAFVAHYGARVARSTACHDLEAIALRALDASRSDPALARMLPVFLWRIRRGVDLDKLVSGARHRRLAPALGYFLELTRQLGPWRGFGPAIAVLRADAKPDHPEYFFHATRKHPFEAMAAEARTPVEARRWGLLTGTPTEGFATYFRKTSAL
jgi:hypothetical protein